MAQLLTPVNVEQAVIDELSSVYTISTRIPDTKPPVFLRVVAAGGASRDLVTDNPLVVLEAFAPTESRAHAALVDAVARLELAARQGTLGSEVCYGLEVSALPQNLPLPSVPSHRRYTTTLAPALRRRVTTL